MGVGRSLARIPRPAHRLDEGEHPVAHRFEHLLRRKLLEMRPAQSVLVGGEHRLLDRLAGAGGLVLPARVQLVQSLDEEQVGKLFDDRERIRDAAGPHGVPDSVDLGLQLTGDHDSIPSVSIEPLNRLDLEVKPIRGCAARWRSSGVAAPSDAMVLHDGFGALHYQAHAAESEAGLPRPLTGRRGAVRKLCTVRRDRTIGRVRLRLVRVCPAGPCRDDVGIAAFDSGAGDVHRTERRRGCGGQDVRRHRARHCSSRVAGSPYFFPLVP